MKKLLFLLVMLMITVVAGATAASGGRPAAAKEKLQKPITKTFCRRGDKEMKMDIYVPKQRRADSVTVIFLFGGGFAGGDRRDETPVESCYTLAEKGFLAIAIDYRKMLENAPDDAMSLLNLTGTFLMAIDTVVEDLTDAILYLYDHQQELGVVTDRIVLSGSSSGAISCLQTDYYRANHFPQVRRLPLDFSPLAVMSYSGAVFFTNGIKSYETPPAPTFFFHGTADKIVNFKGMPPFQGHQMCGSSQVVPIFKKNKYFYWFNRYTDRGHEVCKYLPATINEFCCFVDMVVQDRLILYECEVEDADLPQSRYWDKTTREMFRDGGL